MADFGKTKGFTQNSYFEIQVVWFLYQLILHMSVQVLAHNKWNKNSYQWVFFQVSQLLLDFDFPRKKIWPWLVEAG